MTRLRAAVFLGVLLSVAFACSSCGGGDGTPASPGDSSGAVGTPTDTPYVKSSDQAVGLVFDFLYKSTMLLPSDPNQMTVDRMLYGGAAERAKTLRFNMQVRAADYQCAYGAPCPYPGEPADEPGYFITVRADFIDGSSPVTMQREPGIVVCWVGDLGGQDCAHKILVNGVPTEG